MRPPVRPCGAAVPVHLGGHTFLDMTYKMSDFLRDDGGFTESGTGVWGGPVVHASPTPSSLGNTGTQTISTCLLTPCQ